MMAKSEELSLDGTHLWCVGSQEIASGKWQKGPPKEMQVRTLDKGHRWNRTEDAEHEKAKEKNDEEDIEMKQKVLQHAKRKAQQAISRKPR